MRILVLTNMYPPHHYGGYELNCKEFVDAMRSRGHDVLVLTSDHRVHGVEPTVEDRDDVRRELKLYWADHVVLRPSVRGCLAIERANQRALEDALAPFAPDIISAWHMGCMSFGLLSTCRNRGLPVVHVVNDDWVSYGPLVDRWTAIWRRLGPLARLGERALRLPCRIRDLGAAGTYCFISETTKQASEHGEWTFRRCTIGYCGINTDDFPIGAHPPRTAWSGRLVHVGRIDDRKGIDTAIRALARLDESDTLDVVGRGDERYLAELRTLANDTGVASRVRFRVADRQQLGDIYAGADAVVFPPRWAEPFGLVPLEAMACSTPVIATGTGGSGEFLVDEGNCLVIPVDDDRALAEAVRRLASDADLRGRLVAGGLVTATELTLPRWLDVLETWHRATTADFVDGIPEDRPSVREVLLRALPRS